MNKTLHTTKQLLIAGLLALPMTLATGTAAAGSCPGGSCGVNLVEQAMNTINAAASTVASADLETAYDRIEDVHEQVHETNVGNLSQVRDGIAGLVATLRERAEKEFDEAMKSYWEGYHEQALTKLEEIASLKGLSTAKKASRELDKEEDRVAWRAANESASELIGKGAYLEAREPFSDMKRLANRTDYTEQTKSAMDDFAESMLPDVEAAEKLIVQEQFEDAYATLIEISRLTHARKSSVEARRALGKNAMLPGMRQAKGE
ncbi:MAG: hypothetical protein ACPGYV_14995, partial [Phycisphaeraceae bacterium]